MKNYSSVGRDGGFTLIELLTVIVVITILAGLGLGTWFELLTSSRDDERKSDTSSIARYFEKEYTENASSTYPTYPSVNSLNTDVSKLANSGIKEALAVPGSSSSSSLTAATTTASPPAGLTTETYIYQPFLASGAICTNRSEAQPCVRYKLWYLLEQNSTPQVIESKHQQ